MTPGGTHPIVLFDGVCNLCNSWVNFLIDRDTASVLRFASLQSTLAHAMLRQRGRPIPDDPPASIMVIEGDQVYEGSTAVLRLLGHLSSPGWRLLRFLIAVPRPLRDMVYGWIARNRYRWFGKRDACRVPTPELRERFLVGDPPG